MKKYGYTRVACATPSIKVADVTYNVDQLKSIYEQACSSDVDLLVCPELCITGYTCGDLFHQRLLLDAALEGLLDIKRYSTLKPAVIVVGLPMMIDDSVYNMAAVVHGGQILGLIPKTYLPTYNEFYETRWFANAEHMTDNSVDIDGSMIPIGSQLIFENNCEPYYTFGVEICEDLWSPIPPSSLQSLNGAYILANLSASNDLIGKSDYRKALVKNQSARCFAAYAYASAGYGESTTDVMYGGHSLIAENGTLLSESDRFSLEPTLIMSDIDIEHLNFDRLHSNTYRDTKKHFANHTLQQRVIFHQKHTLSTINRFITQHPFVPSNQEDRFKRCEEIFHIQTQGLAKRIAHIGSPKAIIGISGGLDSTLALLVTVKTFDMLGRNREDIIGVTMPGFGTTGRTYNNAMELMKSLHITIKEISIADAVTQHFKDIEQDANIHDITYENSQARERTQILMDLANKEGGIVVGTGDLSELALGFATYNGDHMSMYGVNVSIPKTLVRYLVEWVSLNEETRKSKDILSDILATPVSPELLPPSADGNIAQKTEEVVGPYELHDFFLYHMLRYGSTPSKIYTLAQYAFGSYYDPIIILKWMKLFYRRFFSQQFKRSALPDGPKVGSICLSPRGDLRMPSDASVALWMAEVETL